MALYLINLDPLYFNNQVLLKLTDSGEKDKNIKSLQQ